MILPNFLIVGAAKCGTTSLANYLSQHPQVYMSSQKEPRFFAFEDELLNFQGPATGINQTSVTSLEGYQALFDSVQQEIAIGEASTIYLYNQKAPLRIRHYIPSAKLIAILRDPAERAYSAFTHLLRDGYETLDFVEGLAMEEMRILNNWPHLWHYTKSGFYAQQIQRYLALFGREQLLICFYRDLFQNPFGLFKEICEFLGIDSTFQPDISSKNISGIPKYKILHSLLTQDNMIKKTAKKVVPKEVRQIVYPWLKSTSLAAKPSLSKDIRENLISLYRDDILELQALLNRDLSAWLCL